MKIITIDTGYFKPGLIGEAKPEGLKTVYYNGIKTRVQTFIVTLSCGSTMRDCQIDRDFILEEDEN